MNWVRRSDSAPPVLELTAKTLFSYRPPNDDIRCDEMYEKFYEQAQDKSKLPIPLKTLELPADQKGAMGVSPSSDRIIQQTVAITATPTATPGKPGTNSFLEAGSEISSIFGVQSSSGMHGAEDTHGWSSSGFSESDQNTGLPDGSQMSAPVPVRARPPRPPTGVAQPPGASAQWKPPHLLADGPRLGGARSASPHQFIRSPFEDSTWDSSGLSQVIQNIRCKSAEVGVGEDQSLFDQPSNLAELNSQAEAYLQASQTEGLRTEQSHLQPHINQSQQQVMFDTDSLTMPQVQQQGSGLAPGWQHAPAQPGSGSMLQPLSPASSAPGASFGFNRMQPPGFGPDEDSRPEQFWQQQQQHQQQHQQQMGQQSQFQGLPGQSLPNGDVLSNLRPMPGMPGLPNIGLPGAPPMPPDPAAIPPERLQEMMAGMNPMEAAAYAQSMQQAYLYAQLQLRMVQAQMGRVGDVPPINPMMGGGMFPQAPGFGMIGQGLSGQNSNTSNNNNNTNNSNNSTNNVPAATGARTMPSGKGNQMNQHNRQQGLPSRNQQQSVRGRGNITPAVEPALPSDGDGLVDLSNKNSKSAMDVAKLACLDQVVGKIYFLSQDQLGCRFLQRQLEEVGENAAVVIFGEVIDHIVDLMTDPFGNYLCQKLLDYCSPPQRSAIVLRVAPHLVSISLNIHGTRAAQKLVERLGPEHSPTPAELDAVVQNLSNGVIELIQDLNGNHVVQRCLQKLGPERNQFIYEAVIRHCLLVASHRHGCCVFQRCVDFASEQQKYSIVMEVVNKTVDLVQDAFGNYVVQYVLDQAPEYRDAIVGIIASSIVELSRQKFSSNVVEKCLQLASEHGQSLMVSQLANKEHILQLLQDPYANYVIQRALQVGKGQSLEALLSCIRPHLPALKNTSYGRKIQSRVIKRCGAGALMEGGPIADLDGTASQAKGKKGGKHDASGLAGPMGQLGLDSDPGNGGAGRGRTKRR